MSEPAEVLTMSGFKVPLKMSVHYVSFSAHSDFQQTSSFIDALQPAYVVLVHGDKNEMHRLQEALLKRYTGKDVKVISPKNCQFVELEFKSDKYAKIVGDLAADAPKVGDTIKGLVIRSEFRHHLLSPGELSEYTQLSTSQITQRLHVTLPHDLNTIVEYLRLLYGSVKTARVPVRMQNGISTYDGIRIENSVVLADLGDNHGMLEWNSSPLADLISDGIVAMLLHMQASPGYALDGMYIGDMMCLSLALKSSQIKQEVPCTVPIQHLSEYFEQVECVSCSKIKPECKCCQSLPPHSHVIKLKANAKGYMMYVDVVSGSMKLCQCVDEADMVVVTTISDDHPTEPVPTDETAAKSVSEVQKDDVKALVDMIRSVVMRVYSATRPLNFKFK